MTLVVTTNDLRIWNGVALQFAALKEKHLMILGDWQGVESANDDLVRELTAPIHRIE